MDEEQKAAVEAKEAELDEARAKAMLVAAEAAALTTQSESLQAASDNQDQIDREQAKREYQTMVKRQQELVKKQQEELAAQQQHHHSKVRDRVKSRRKAKAGLFIKKESGMRKSLSTKHAAEFSQLANELGVAGKIEEADEAALEANKILQTQLAQANEELEVLRQQMAKMGAAASTDRTSAMDARAEAKMSGGGAAAVELETVQRKASLNTLARMNSEVREMKGQGEAAAAAKIAAEAQAKNALRKMASLEQKNVELEMMHERDQVLLEEGGGGGGEELALLHEQLDHHQQELEQAEVRSTTHEASVKKIFLNQNLTYPNSTFSCRRSSRPLGRTPRLPRLRPRTPPLTSRSRPQQ